MPKPKTTKLQVFKGREAKLNHAIFQTLALKGPQTIYDIHKSLRAMRRLRGIHYGNVNKRVRALEQADYLRIVGIHNTKAGFEAMIYELTAKALLTVVLDSFSSEELLDIMTQDVALEILAAIVTLLPLHSSKRRIQRSKLQSE